MDESDNGTLEFWSSSSVDGSWGESLPDNGLADVGCDEERDTATKTVALLQKLVQKNDYQGCGEKLDNKEDTNTGAEVRWLAVETSQDVDTGLTKREDDREKLSALVVVRFERCVGANLLGSLVELAVGLQVEVDIDEVSASEKLSVLAVSLLLKSKCHTWKTMPEEMIGVIPSSISVPLLLAIIILSQYNGSEVSNKYQRPCPPTAYASFTDQMTQCRKEASGS